MTLERISNSCDILLLVQKRCNLFCLTNDHGVKKKKLPKMAADSLLVNKIAKNVKHICTRCNNFYSTLTYLEAHIKAEHEKMYSREKSNKCSQCNFESARAGDLKKHLRRHSGEKSNKCNQCNYASSYPKNLRTHLKRHLKIHSGEKSYKCNQCDYASSQASALKTHLKMHSGEKSNKCNQDANN